MVAHARRDSRRLRVAAVVAGVGLLLAHLGLMWAAFGEIDARMITIDVGLAAIAVFAVVVSVRGLTAERTRAAVESHLTAVLETPRDIHDTAAATLAVLREQRLIEAGVVALLDESPTLHIVAANGYAESMWRAATPPLIPANGDSLRRETVTHPWVEPIRDRVRSRPWVARIPLLAGDEPIGVALLVLSRPGPLRDARVRRLIGRHLSAALDHAALYEAAYARELDLVGQEQRRRDFMGAISHELRTPLTSIGAFADLLEMNREAMDDSARQLVSSLSSGVERLNVLVRDLIDLGRSGDSDYPLAMNLAPVNGVIERAASIMRPAAILRGQEITLDLPGEPLEAVVDPKLLEQIILNLLSNANRHAPAGTVISVRAAATASGVTIVVADTGPGIPPAYLERVFEPYFRVPDREHADVPGSGLGLAVARRIVERMGGRLWAENQTEGGACFTVALTAPAHETGTHPAHPTEVSRLDAEPRAAAAHAPAAGATNGAPTS